MKSKLIGLCIICIFATEAAQSQSLFYMAYRFTDLADTAEYNVFLVREEDGTGFYRVRFTDAETHEDMVVELDMEEKYFTEKNGYTDTTKLYFKGSNPRIIQGDKDYKYYPERFWFKQDRNTGLFEPWAVTSPDEQGTANAKFTEPPVLLEQQDLTEDLVGAFFFEDDAFYKNLFTVKPRSLTPQQRKDVLHLVIVANTDDDLIGNTCVLDKDRNLKMFKDLAEFMGIGFDSKVIFGADFSKQNVASAVNNLQPNAHDLVVFYYSGHGFNDPNANRSYPNMALSNKSFDDAMASSMNIEDVYNTIKAKGARFNLVLSDCCNNRPDDRAILSCDVPRTRSTTLGWSLENCKALFMNEKPISILATAAQRGEQSTGNISYGGFYTHNFRTNLISYFKPLHIYPTWPMLLQEAEKSTVEQAENSRCSQRGEGLKTYKQHPIYRIQ